MTDKDVKRLGEGRWVVPIMALLSREQGARFAAIASRFGLSHHSLSRTLDQLRGWGWVRPNQGHGHPLRPEYVLGETGVPVGRVCDRIMSERERMGLEPAHLPRWSLPLIAGLGGDWLRFGDLRTRLDPVTPRALSLTLQQMVGRDLVARRLEERFAVVPLYGLTDLGQGLAEALAA
jgi:DNA-binding HxlR family transcriptional regulator